MSAKHKFMPAIVKEMMEKQKKKKYKDYSSDPLPEDQPAAPTPPTPYDPISDYAKYQEKVDQLAEESKKKQNLSREEGKKRAEELFNRPIEGLTQQQRTSLQESANHQINRDVQGYQRQLVSQQGRRGVTGGAAYAQNADLARIGASAQQQFQRDLAQTDADLAMKKLAAMFNVEQGEVSQELLNQQAAADLLKAYNEEARQRYLAEQASRLFQDIEAPSSTKDKFKNYYRNTKTFQRI